MSNNKPLNVRLRGNSNKNADRKKSTSIVKKVKKKDDKVVNSNNNGQKKQKKSKKIGWKIFRIFLLLGLAMCIVGVGIVLGVISGIIDGTDSISLDELELLPQTSFVYDMNGNQIAALYDSENRIVVSYEDIPKHTVDAVVAIEDERFYKHHGIDLKRTIGAIGNYVIKGGDSDYGASTITQQLVKNITSDNERAWQRKIREWYRAISLETKLSKEKIFESYVNTIYYGDSSWGIEVAANHFFGKSVSELNIAESAAIAAMIQSPEITNAYRSDEARAALLARKDLVLGKMLSLGFINQQEYDEAKAYNLEFKSKQVNYGGTQTYFVDAVVEAVIADLMEQRNVSRGIALKMIYTDGYKINSTQDPDVQAKVDYAFTNGEIFYDDIQGAMVVLDHSTGQVRGLIGGAGQKVGALTLNRATQSYRQPGSCMKPFGAYGPAMEKGLLNCGSGIDDNQFTMGNWTPHNWYGSFYGFVTVRDAISDSMNIPAAKANLLVGDEDYCWNFAYNCGLTSLSESDKSAASLGLGGVTNGFTPMMMANAYGTIANGGYWIKPKLYTTVVDRNGNIVLDNSAIDGKQVMKDSTSYMLASCLQSVVTTPVWGTAYGAVSIQGGAMPCAGKTGNTNDDKDRWFCGFTKYYTIACWTGYDQPVPINRGYPYDSTKLFNSVMNMVCEGKEPAEIMPQPSSVRSVALCRDSGKVPTDACNADPRGSRVLTDLCAIDAIPTETCTVHEFVNICNVSKKLASSSCSSTSKESRLVRSAPSQGQYPSDWGYTKPTETCSGNHSGSSATPGNPRVTIYRNGVAQ